MVNDNGPIFNVYRDGMVHVCKEQCSTCIFRPGDLMNLGPGRVKEMVKQAVAGENSIVCHQTLEGGNAVCRGFFDAYKTTPLQVAERLQKVNWVTPQKDTFDQCDENEDCDCGTREPNHLDRAKQVPHD